MRECGQQEREGKGATGDATGGEVQTQPDPGEPWSARDSTAWSPRGKAPGLHCRTSTPRCLSLLVCPYEVAPATQGDRCWPGGAKKQDLQAGHLGRATTMSATTHFPGQVAWGGRWPTEW